MIYSKCLSISAYVVFSLCALNAQAKSSLKNDADISGLRASYGKCIEATGGITPAMQKCMSAEYTFQDKRLNAAYKRLITLLDKDQKIKQREEEIVWIKYRKTHCAVDSNGGQAAAISSYDCTVLETAKQAATLENRLMIERLKQ